jgi:hypothetical protein
MVGEFDATDAVRFYIGLKSVAHWLAWACSMADGTAREHVRVARALRLMPLTVEEFGAGRLSYSKVREMSRIHDEMDEAALIELARAATASQLARMVQGYRAASGTRMGQEVFREASWVTRDDGMVEIRALLPAEEGAEVVAEHTIKGTGSGTFPRERPSEFPVCSMRRWKRRRSRCGWSATSSCPRTCVRPMPS